MAERRFPLSAEDDEGARHQGELLIVRAWQPDVKPSADAAFTVVLAQQPLAPDSAPPSAPNVAVCAPASPVRLPAAVAEAAVAYGADDAQAPPLRLSRGALSAYAGGSLLAAQPLSITAREVFGEDGGNPRLDSLVRDLLAAAGRNERYWRALGEALSRPDPPTRLVRRDQLRNRLRRLLDEAPQPHTAVRDAIDRLRQIADGAAPGRLQPSPGALADDVAFVRCLTERPQEAAELATMRTYLDGARPSADAAELTSDYPYTREQLSFVTVFDQPHRLDGIRATFESFRSRYTKAYVAHHQTYWQAVAPLRASLEEAAPAAQALARLNTLRALGRPVGGPELDAYQRLTQRRSACAERNLASALRERPTCPQCNVTMEESAPTKEADEVLRRLQAALARQQARLASEAVRRILARGGERLERFLQIVQASDMAGLAQVLDDQLLAFLRELLAEPVAPSVPPPP